MHGKRTASTSFTTTWASYRAYFRRSIKPRIDGHLITFVGETGYVVGDLEEIARAVALLDRIDPIRCRRRVEALFDAPRMVDAYLAAYRSILVTMAGTENGRQSGERPV